MLLFDYVPRLSELLSIKKLLRNAIVLQLGMDKNLAPLLYSKTVTPEYFLDNKKIIKI